MDELALLKEEIKKSEYSEELGAVSDAELKELMEEAKAEAIEAGELPDEKLDEVNGGMKIILIDKMEAVKKMIRKMIEIQKKKR